MILPDKTLVRMCDLALMNHRKPCKIVSFLPPEKSSTDPACARCSRAGHITVFISPSATRSTPEGNRDEYHNRDVQSELHAQLAAALQSSLPSVSPPPPVEDKALIEALKDATNFVVVEQEDGDEQFGVEGAPPDSDSDDNINKLLDRSSVAVKLVKGYSAALGRLFFG